MREAAFVSIDALFRQDSVEHSIVDRATLNQLREIKPVPNVEHKQKQCQIFFQSVKL